jgi:signal transduction histidine kinase
MNKLMRQLRTGATPVENPRPVNLEPLIRNVCAGKAERETVIDLDLSQGIFALGHPERLESVIGHLVQNALDASGGGKVGVRLLRDEGAAVVEIADQGAGMTADFIQERLFKPFQTTKPTGMGVGVYESSQYVTSLGGRLLVESAPGSGTRVRVVLPLGHEPSAADLKPQEAA